MVRGNYRFSEWIVRTISGYVRRCPVDRRVKVGFAELCYHLFAELNIDYIFASEQIDIKWSTKGFPDILTRHMMFEGLYQEDVLECIKNLARDGDTIFDVGGHHGLMAVVASKAVGARGCVVTFEPNPVARRFLHETLLINGVTNARIEPIGLHEKDGLFDFFVQRRRRVSWNSSFVRDFVDPDCKITPLKVQAQTVDSYVRRTGLVPNLIKIDTEGTEIDVLRGAGETIRTYKPVLLLEMNSISADRAHTSIAEIAHFLYSHTYEIFVLKRLKNGRYSYQHREAFDEKRHGRSKLINVACVPGRSMSDGRVHAAIGSTPPCQSADFPLAPSPLAEVRAPRGRSMLPEPARTPRGTLPSRPGMSDAFPIDAAILLCCCR